MNKDKVLTICAVLLLLLSFMFSCQKKNKIQEKEHSEKFSLEITGHTFYKVKIIKGDTLLYQSCDGNIPNYVVYKDSIYCDWGIEQHMLVLSSLENKGNTFKLITTYKNGSVPDYDDKIIFKALGTKKYWEIHNELYIDALYKNSIPYKKESCIECGNCDDSVNDPTEISSKEEPISIETIFEINKQWSNHCEKGVDKDNIMFYNFNEITFGVSSFNFICGATSKKIDNSTIEIYLKDMGKDYAPNGEIYSNNNTPKESVLMIVPKQYQLLKLNL